MRVNLARRIVATLLLAFAAALPTAAATLPGAAETQAAPAQTQPRATAENDLREFRVGMNVNEMPLAGYLGFICAGSGGQKLENWHGYRQCPAEASGWHAVRFQYDESANPLAKVNGLYEGTKVGGHPVLLTALIGDDGGLRGLVIETDPAARLYLRKKAFLFGEQVKARFGDASWNCVSQEPTADQEPVGGLFINEHCDKTTPTRRLTLDRAFFRLAGREVQNFTSRSRLEILGRDDQQTVGTLN